MQTTYREVASICAIAGLLAGCSGGGGESSPTTPIQAVTSFPLQSGYKSLIANGLTKSFTVSGTCSGTGTKTSAAATTAATFEGVSGFSAAVTLTMSLSSCSPASIAQTSTAYFDSNYVPLGMNSVGVNYGVYAAPLAIPSSVKVGDTGLIGTMNLYTNSTKATSNGSQQLSYVVEADSTTTAIVNLIGRVYSAGNTLTATEQDRYRIDSVGTLTPLTADIQYSNGTHFVLTYN